MTSSSVCRRVRDTKSHESSFLFVPPLSSLIPNPSQDIQIHQGKRSVWCDESEVATIPTPIT